MDSSSSYGSSGNMSPLYGRSRTRSVSSDRTSTTGFDFVLPPLAISPEFCFIASSAASQIITNDHDSHADAWYDQNSVLPAVEPATISGSALQLVNGFLDQLLLNILQLAKATHLSAIRPAIIEVLRPKLAKDAISNAEEELKEYLGDAGEDDFFQPQRTGVSRNWDLELAWKRTRLRCMVYSSLGDMEEEDEDMYMQEENLEFGANEHISDTVSPAVAIFLTSVLEYMGELTLTVAGQAAYGRVQNKIENELREGFRGPSEPADRIVVGDADMDRVALDRTLGRLWRGWKKRMRTPANDSAGRSFPRPASVQSQRESGPPGQSDPVSPMSATSRYSNEPRQSHEYLEPPIVENVDAVEVPLPVTENDVDEIEVPGLVYYSDDETDIDSEQTEEKPSKRPWSSLLSSSVVAPDLLTRAAAANPSTAKTKTKAQTKTSRRTQPQHDLIGTRSRSSSVPSRLPPNFYPRAQRPPPVHASDEMPETMVEAAKPEQADAQDNGDTESECDDTGEEITCQKVEVVMPSQVLRSGTFRAVPSDSSGNNSPFTRQSSMRSARLIDVPAPSSPSSRSPAHSRACSAEKSGRFRPVSLSAVATSATLSRTAALDEGQSSARQISADQATREETSSEGASVNPAEDMPPQKASLESDRNQTRRPTRYPGPDQELPPSTGPLSAGGLTARAQAHQKEPMVKINTRTPTYVHDQASTAARLARLPAISTNQVLDEGSVTGLRPKEPNHLSKQSNELRTVDRARVVGESDEPSLPFQGISSVRQVPTAASSVSSVTSRLKPLRTSEDGSSRSESVARNFEELIQSNQTITYTLTPETMRDVDSKSPVVTKLPNRKMEDARSLNSSKTSLFVPHSGSGRLPSPHSHLASNNPRAAEDKISRAPTGSTLPTGRGVGSLPREPRVPTDTSTSEFTDFMKSSGPTEKAKVFALPRISSPTSPGRSVGDSRRASTTSSINRIRYQPRDAVVDSRADNSDLIDFIRQGPPVGSTNPRIPRHVAPFRTTMDSDEMSGAIGGKAIDACIPDIRDSVCSANITESAPSMHSSINSKSALLRNKSGAPTTSTGLFGADDDMMMPKRKTRRVRDPYAIDFSDEDEDEDQEEEEEEEEGRYGGRGTGRYVEAPKIAVKREESLAEFLRNYDPPPEPAHSPPRMPKKKSSAPSLMARFSRSGGKDRDKERAKDSASTREGQFGNGRGGFIPLKVGMATDHGKYDAAGLAGTAGPPVSSRPRVHSMMASSSQGARVPMKKFEPREAVVSKTHTAELAAFLRDSEPPRANSPMVAMNRAPSSREESISSGGGGGGIGKRFGRRKKSVL